MGEFAVAVMDDQDGVDGLSEVSSVIVSPDGAHVYAAGRGRPLPLGLIIRPFPL